MHTDRLEPREPYRAGSPHPTRVEEAMGFQDLSGRPAALGTIPWPGQTQQIVEGAENRLRHNSYLALKNVHCDYHEGVLTLRGCLPTYYLKQVAQSVVAHVEGVQRIVNEIEVVTTARR